MNCPLDSANQHFGILDECYADKPHLRQRLIEISDMIDALVAQGSSAHEAEARAIEQIRRVGKGILTEWAEKAEAAAVAKARAGDPALRSYRKKLLTWRSTYGEVSVLEQRLRQGRRGGQVRPFCRQAQISAASLFAAVTAGTDGLRRRPFVCGGDARKCASITGSNCRPAVCALARWPTPKPAGS